MTALLDTRIRAVLYTSLAKEANLHWNPPRTSSCSSPALSNRANRPTGLLIMVSMDAPLNSLDSLASGYLQLGHSVRERIQLLTQYFSRSPVETWNITSWDKDGSLVLERYNAGHIGFAHVLGGRRVQNSSWMWDKFKDEWHHRASSPGIASGQLSAAL